MTKTRLTELQKEIERLEAIDKAITERVEAEFNSTHTLYIDENGDAMEFLNSGGDPLELNQSNEFIEIGCSLQQDMEWANESENIM